VEAKPDLVLAGQHRQLMAFPGELGRFVCLCSKEINESGACSSLLAYHTDPLRSRNCHVYPRILGTKTLPLIPSEIS
jgi:hypothetical protein